MKTKHHVSRSIAALLLTLTVLQTSNAGNILATPGSLIRLERADGWSVGFECRTGSRHMENIDEVLLFDIERVLARIGYSPLSFLHLSAEAGSVRATHDANTFEWGLDYAATAKVSLFEQTIRSSPAVPRKRAIVAGVEMTYRHSESSFEDVDFEWDEYVIIPTITYVADKSAELIRHPQTATGIEAAIGIAFSQIDALGTRFYGETRNHGLMVEFGAMLFNEWVVHARGVWYGGDDDELTIGTSYYF